MIEIDTIDFCVLGIPVYFFCFVISFVLTTCVYIALISSKKYDLSQSMKILFLSLGGMVIGAKIFGFMSGIYRNIGVRKTINIETLMDTGIVYYGGLLGFVTVYYILLKRKTGIIDFEIINILGVCIPLFHSIARIGCFLSGCCYGQVYQGPLSVKYRMLIDGNVDVNQRFPVQIVEALYEFGLFIYFFVLIQSRDWEYKRIFLRYLVLYTVFRFVVEFMRGDIRRGVICGISFSQCISVLIWIIIIGYLVKLKEE